MWALTAGESSSLCGSDGGDFKETEGVTHFVLGQTEKKHCGIANMYLASVIEAQFRINLAIPGSSPFTAG